MSDPDTPTDDKYVTFHRQTFYEMLEGLRPSAFEKFALKDAVVIRRQDKFASPCLLTYASMIGLVGENHPDPKVRAELLAISDYFQRQGELAGEEAYKLPDL